MVSGIAYSVGGKASGVLWLLRHRHPSALVKPRAALCKLVWNCGSALTYGVGAFPVY